MTMMERYVLVAVLVTCGLGIGTTDQVYDTSLNNYYPHPGVALVTTDRWQEDEGSNSTIPKTNSTTPGLLIKGFTCLGLSVIGFGSSLVPVRHLDTGDGMFFQFVFCSTLALESFLVYFIQGCPQIWSFSLVSGFLFAIGNLTVIPIMSTIGLGMGYLIWSVFSLLTAWATARFGWFGLDQQEVPSPTLNYIGTALATIGALILFFINTVGEDKCSTEEAQPLLHKTSVIANQGPDEDCLLTNNNKMSWVEKVSPMSRKIIGSFLATFAGIIFGCSYTPILYIKNSSLRNGSYFSGASQFDLDYVFPYMTGVHTLNSAAFFVYCMGMKNLPVLPINCVLPAFFSASLQFASQCCFFIACYCLGTIITYPIGTAGPALVTLIWSVFYFKEIRGTQNFLILCAVLTTVLSGVTLIFISKM